MRGIVTADNATFLYNPVKNLKTNQIQIGGETYTLTTSGFKGYVGQEVEYYVTYKDYEEDYCKFGTFANFVLLFCGSKRRAGAES